MSEQLSIPLEMATLNERQRLYAAYERCRHFRRRVSFEDALREPLYRHCLELTAESMQRKEEHGRA